MLTNAVNAQRVYNGAWRDVDGEPVATGGDGQRDLPARPASESR